MIALLIFIVIFAFLVFVLGRGGYFAIKQKDWTIGILFWTFAVAIVAAGTYFTVTSY